jgi:hypothetical protein
MLCSKGLIFLFLFVGTKAVMYRLLFLMIGLTIENQYLDDSQEYSINDSEEQTEWTYVDVLAWMYEVFILMTIDPMSAKL